jgi:serine/threonine protein kinase
MKSKHSVEFINGIKDNNYYYIIMELCDGDLNKLLTMKKGNLDIITIIKIVIQINEAFKLMRNKKIEHRDLKPENILIKFVNEKDFVIKLSDYGLAKYYENSNAIFSSQAGTRYYMAPEVYNNKGNSKSDLWSIGIILYYLYFNTIPFKNWKGFFTSNNNIILKKSNFDLFDNLLSKLIIKDPNERISWEDYFTHPFNNLQIIEIYINIEQNNTNTQILNNEYFNYEQLKDSIIYVDQQKNIFNTNFKLDKGKHKIIIYFNNIINNSSSMFN